jgi:hypothetical protein
MELLNQPSFWSPWHTLGCSNLFAVVKGTRLCTEMLLHQCSKTCVPLAGSPLQLKFLVHLHTWTPE